MSCFDEDGNIPKVVAVAIKYLDDDMIYTIPKPARHHNVIHKLTAMGLRQPHRDEQGFLLSDGTFARRPVARGNAVMNNQLLPRAGSLKDLYSEDVW